MKRDNRTSWAVFWGLTAAGAVTVGLLLAVFLGYLLGHFTHTRTKTVAVRTVTASGGATAAGSPALTSAGSGSASLWSTPNNGPYNHRVATSTITSSNVNQLGVAWKLPLTFSKAGTFGYFASTPVVGPDDTAYFIDLTSNVFAVDMSTGELKWRHAFNTPDEGPNGLTLVDGVLYGSTSTNAFAVDAQTGAVRWISPRLPNTVDRAKAAIAQSVKDGATQGEKGNFGQGVNFAPQVTQGRVIISTSGQPTGGQLFALDQKTGAVLWHLQEVPDAADRTQGAALGTGGAWNAPAIGPDGTIYIGIGNPYRNNTQAIDHPSPLLYDDSTLAIDPATGKVKWHYQGVPNDFYDWDMQLSPVFVQQGGRSLVLDAGKMGYVYAIDAQTGTLVWKTPVGMHNGHDDDGLLAEQHKFHPTYPYKVYPGALGGVETNMAVADGVAYVPIVNLYQMRPSATAGLTLQPVNQGTGEMAALDVATGKILWDTKLPSMAFGAATVSNDLVFTTTYDGKVIAMARQTGKIVWQGTIPGGTNAPVVIQGDTALTVATLSNPQVIAWRLGASAPSTTSTSTSTSSSSTQAAAGGGAVSLSAGKTQFTSTCSSCHTLSEAGTHGTVGPNLDQLKPSMALVVHQVTNGGGGMPAFGHTLSATQIQAVARYVSTVAGTGNNGAGGASTGAGNAAP